MESDRQTKGQIIQIIDGQECAQKNQSSILIKGKKTDRRMDICNYRIASLIKRLQQ